MNVSGVHHPIDRPRGAIAAATRTVKRLAKRTLASRHVSRAWTRLIEDRATFIMLHRFAEPEHGLFGHVREDFRQVLERLRRERYPLLTVDEAVTCLLEGRPLPRRAVVFTMDDGYRGALEQSADLFEAFDVPLTVFLATGFIDGSCWLWWDEIEYVCLASRRPSIELEWNDTTKVLELTDRRTTIGTLLEVCEWCKTLPDPEKWRFIRCLADAAEVDVPTRPPAAYAPLTWDDARRLESRGFSFGPHTVTHPILPMVDDRQAAREIAESWRRVKQELARPLDVLAYPNGSYGPRELRLLADTGLRAAVTTRGAYAAPVTGPDDPARFEIPRFGYPEEPDPVMLIASGFKTIELSLGL